MEGNAIADAYWANAAHPRVKLLEGLHGQGLGCAQMKKRHDFARKETMAIEASLSAVRRHVNAFLPVATLPPEVLAHVFFFLTLEEPHFYPDPKDFYRSVGHDGDLRPRLGWVRVSHVSHHWREVALGQPSLWSNITFSLGPDCAEEFLSRSKAVPILLDLLDPYYESETIIPDIVQRNLHRTHTLHLGNYVEVEDVSDEDAERYPSFTGPAPLLHTFRTYFATHEGIEWHPELFGGNAPRLRVVYIHGMSAIAWTSPLLRSLTSLHVERDMKCLRDDQEAVFPEATEVFGALQRMPALESFTLRGVLPKRANLSEADVERFEARLPRLSRLELGGDFVDAVRLLPYFVWKADARVTVDAGCEQLGSREDFEDALTMLHTHLSGERSSYKRLSMLRVQHVSTLSSVYQVSAWRGEDDGRLEGEPDLSIRMRERVGEERRPFHPDRLCAAFPLEHLRTLDVRGKHAFIGVSRWEKVRWRFAFEKCREVVRVRCDNATGGGLLEALFDDAYQSANPSHSDSAGTLHFPPRNLETVMFPRLRRLSICMEQIQWRWVVMTEHGGEQRASDMLLFVLRERAKTECPVKEVFLTDPVEAVDDHDENWSWLHEVRRRSV